MKKLEFLAQQLESLIADADEAVQNVMAERNEYAKMHGHGFLQTRIYKEMTKQISREAGRGEGLAKALNLVMRLQYTDVDELRMEELEEDQ